MAPIYGGVGARVLFVARDPGPKTQGEQGGSGFLSLENDDASAERFATLLEEAGIPVIETLPWNAYPWYINRDPRAAELEDGVEPLARLLGLLPRLRVVVLLGGSAQDGWRRLERRHPARVFGIDLEGAVNRAAFDGRFRSGPLTGRTVNVKWYLKQEGVLDRTASAALDYYLVLTGPYSAAVSSRSSTRPWLIDAVYLFAAAELRAQQRQRNAKTGVAASVLQSQWQAAQIFPVAPNSPLRLTPEQVRVLRLFASPADTDTGSSASETSEARN